MTPREFYKEYSTQKSCIQLLYEQYKSKISDCKSCKSKRVKWYENKAHWRCLDCKKKISLKSISFMRDSKISFKYWVEVMYLLLETKKSFSICEIQRLTSMKRYGTVYYMVQKIRVAIAEINRSLKMKKKSLIFFDLHTSDAPTNPPTYLQILYGKNDASNFDFIHLDLPGYLKFKCEKLNDQKLDEKNYRFKKVLSFKNLNDKRKTIESFPLQKKWAKCIGENLLKEIKGIYHSISLLHLQKVLDEYSFKYNYRHERKSKFIIFVEKLET